MCSGVLKPQQTGGRQSFVNRYTYFLNNGVTTVSLANSWQVDII
jgi:hypothetical protein